MGVIEKRVNDAVSKALKPLEEQFLKNQKDAIKTNREAMFKKIEEMRNDMAEIIEIKVREALENERR